MSGGATAIHTHARQLLQAAESKDIEEVRLPNMDKPDGAALVPVERLHVGRERTPASRFHRLLEIAPVTPAVGQSPDADILDP